MLIKFSKQIGNSFAKIINTKVSSKPCQTSEMELFSQVVPGIRGELRRIVENEKQKQGSENASELASRVKDVSFLNQFKYQR